MYLHLFEYLCPYSPQAGRQVLSSMVTLVSMVRDDITRQASSDEGEGLVACVKSVTEAVEALVKTIE